MLGVITGRDVMRNGWTIMREFGPAAYGRCVLAVVTGRPSTFLAIVAGHHRRRTHRSTSLAIAASIMAAGAGVTSWSSTTDPVEAGCIAECETARSPR